MQSVNDRLEAKVRELESHMADNEDNGKAMEIIRTLREEAQGWKEKFESQQVRLAGTEKELEEQREAGKAEIAQLRGKASLGVDYAKGRSRSWKRTAEPSTRTHWKN